MQADPRPLSRPVIVLGGIYDPGFVAEHVAHELREIAAPDSRIISLTFFEIHTFDHCAQKLVDAVDHEFPTDDPQQTVEVDVVGFSMGGLVARWAAAGRQPDQSTTMTTRPKPAARQTLPAAASLDCSRSARPSRRLRWPGCAFDQRVIGMRRLDVPRGSTICRALWIIPPPGWVIPWSARQFGALVRIPGGWHSLSPCRICWPGTILRILADIEASRGGRRSPQNPLSLCRRGRR
jgi:hypothetical protein